MSEPTFPKASPQKLKTIWRIFFQCASDDGNHSLVIDFGLKQEMLRPLNTPRSFEPDPLISLINGLNNLKKDEKCVFQDLFQAVRNPWLEMFSGLLASSKRQATFCPVRQVIDSGKAKVFASAFSDGHPSGSYRSKP